MLTCGKKKKKKTLHVVWLFQTVWKKGTIYINPSYSQVSWDAPLSNSWIGWMEINHFIWIPPSKCVIQFSFVYEEVLCHLNIYMAVEGHFFLFINFGFPARPHHLKAPHDTCVVRPHWNPASKKFWEWDRVSSADRLAATWTLDSAIPSQPVTYIFCSPSLPSMASNRKSKHKELSYSNPSLFSLSLSLQKKKEKKNLSFCPNSESHYYYYVHETWMVFLQAAFICGVLGGQ